MKKSLLLFSFLTFKMLCFAQDPIAALPQSNFYFSTVTCNSTADFSYSASEYCINSFQTLTPIFNSNSIAGIFSSIPSGLLLNFSTGEISLAGSIPGNYTVTNTIAVANGCPEVNFSSNITINNQPVAYFTYAQTNYCRNGVNPSPILLGVAGIFTSFLPGLDLNPITGEINLANSTAGTYTVSNEIPAAGGCAQVNAVVNITITEPPFGSFSYNTPLYISTLVPQIPTAAVTAGGVYSSAPGLVIDATTGAIDSSASSAGSYTVTYDIPANAGCYAFNTNFDVTILLSLNTNHFSDFSVQLFPNPSNSKLYIKTSNDIILDTITITDLLGKIVATQTNNTTAINVEELATGLYLIKGFSGNQKFQSKFIKK